MPSRNPSRVWAEIRVVYDYLIGKFPKATSIADGLQEINLVPCDDICMVKAMILSRLDKDSETRENIGWNLTVGEQKKW